MENVVKKENIVSRQLLGIDFVTLSIGKDTIVAKMLYKNRLILFRSPSTQMSKAVMSLRVSTN